MELIIKRLSEVPLEDGVAAYNMGFEGYFYDQIKSIDTFSARFGLDSLSPELSLVGYMDSQPVAILLSGMKRLGGDMVAWTSGMGVAKPYRGMGIAKKLMRAAIAIYRKNDVKYATLEVLSRNDSAIRLYESIGYKKVSKLKFMQTSRQIEFSGILQSAPYKYELKNPRDLSRVSFYRDKTPWQTHRDNACDGLALILRDQANAIVGYTLFKKLYREDRLVSIGLLQLEVSPVRNDTEEITRELLRYTFFSEAGDFQRTTVNLPEEKWELVSILKEYGFQEWDEQLWMVKKLG